MEPGEIANLEKNIQKGQRGNDKQDSVFDLDEGVVEPPGVGMVDDEPETGQQEIGDFHHEERVAETVRVEGSGSAHGAGELVMEMVGRVDEEEEGEQLEYQGIAQNGGDQVGAPLQGKLQLTAAPDIPLSQD